MVIECPECHGKVSDTLPNCPHCGYRIKTSRPAKILMLPTVVNCWLAVSIVAIVLTVFTIISNTSLVQDELMLLWCFITPSIISLILAVGQPKYRFINVVFAIPLFLIIALIVFGLVVADQLNVVALPFAVSILVYFCFDYLCCVYLLRMGKHSADTMANSEYKIYSRIRCLLIFCSTVIGWVLVVLLLNYLVVDDALLIVPILVLGIVLATGMLMPTPKRFENRISHRKATSIKMRMDAEKDSLPDNKNGNRCTSGRTAGFAFYFVIALIPVLVGAAAGALFLFLDQFPLSVSEPPSGMLKHNAHTAGETKILTLPGGVQMEMAWCPPGAFVMGSRKKHSNATPHCVTLTSGFWIGKYEVTREQWYRVMGTMPWGWGRLDEDEELIPVSDVSWDDCQAFIAKVKSQTGISFSLPSEAQWEYACRAGAIGEYCKLKDGTEVTEDTVGKVLSDRDRQWYDLSNRDDITSNAWGIFHMLGRDYEWCQDGYRDFRWHERFGRGAIDPVESGIDFKVIKGGVNYRSPNTASWRWRNNKSDSYRMNFRICCSDVP